MHKAHTEWTVIKKMKNGTELKEIYTIQFQKQC